MYDPIRFATAEDAESIADFQIAMALETENKTLCPDEVLTAVKSVFADTQKGFYLVADVDSEVVGSLMITYEWSDWRNCNMWYIQSVFVKPANRGKGLFSQMFHKVVELAKKENAMYVRLYVETENEKAQAAYENLGMKRMPYFMYDMKVE
ncbi:GNAT family N-acetyltransferase [Mariniblastus fucicola]|uniref:Putative acetyltransferase n=1 Tax=Mariniblastus fucicola TaxID=980251 RepID=A0A5B9PFC8_9BACT|nr:GNAT family N-acetyltransferase [Mariniblastus fucicola]QEG23905.1 putative acetyltransferase [Mariniblastus fucicola]